MIDQLTHLYTGKPDTFDDRLKQARQPATRQALSAHEKNMVELRLILGGRK